MNDIRQDQDVWYRNFYVWLVIILPLCAVAASFVTLYIASANAPDMAVADYGNISAIAAQERKQDKLAAALGMQATLTFSYGTENPALASVRIELSSAETSQFPETLELRTVHSTIAALDSAASLRRSGPNTYSGEIAIPQGSYDMYISDAADTWRLGVRSFGYPGEIKLSSTPDTSS